LEVEVIQVVFSSLTKLVKVRIGMALGLGLWVLMMILLSWEDLSTGDIAQFGVGGGGIGLDVECEEGGVTFWLLAFYDGLSVSKCISQL
jgi:hypothetical protein